MYLWFWLRFFFFGAGGSAINSELYLLNILIYRSHVYRYNLIYRWLFTNPILTVCMHVKGFEHPTHTNG